MKKALLISIAIVWSICLYAQQVEELEYDTDQVENNGKTKPNDEIHTLFGSNQSHGGYGAFNIRYSEIDSRDGLYIGGRGGWIIGHSLAIGGGGCGFFNTADESPIMQSIDLEDDNRYNIGGGYGGILIEPILASRFPVHLSFPILLGAGGVSFAKENISNDPSTLGQDEWIDYSVDSDGFFIIEPGVELELNLLQFFRIGFGATYKFTTDITLEAPDNTPLVTEDFLNGFTFGMTFKFGKF